MGVGPAVGAIMGGPRNFRYDLLGDTGVFLFYIYSTANWLT